VLFTRPSRYSSAIGHTGVFSLGGWSPRLRARFLGSGATQDLRRGASVAFAYRALTVCGAPSQGTSADFSPRSRGSYNPGALHRPRFGLRPVRSPLLGASRLISLPPGTEMFQFPGFASGPSKGPDDRPVQAAGFPHSATRGSPAVCASPRLFAAYRGLPRLCVPRHPPHAFFHLTTRHSSE
jgi:hypothetical protein